MRCSILFLAGFASALAGSVVPADAVGLGRSQPSVAASRLAEGAPTLAPFAHVVFCNSYPSECRTNQVEPKSVKLSAENLRLLRRVNAGVNKAIRPVNDKPGAMNDRWSLSPAKGDCEDFAITKRHRLVQAGLPASALRLVTAVTPSGEGHAALAVSTDQGDVLLDNRHDDILSWNRANLTIVKIQSSTDPRRWYSAAGEAVASND